MDRNTKQINLAKLNSRFYVEVLTLPVVAEPTLRATMHVQFSSHNTTRLACPFSFFIPYSTENVPVSCTFHLQMVPFLHTHKRVLDHFSTSVTDQIAKTGSRGLKCNKGRGTKPRFAPKYIGIGQYKTWTADCGLRTADWV